MEEEEDIPWEGVLHPGEDDFRVAMAHLRQGERPEALVHFVAAYEAQNYRRGAYLGAMVMADMLGELDEVETAALMGACYFPEEPLFPLARAVVALRRGQPEGVGEGLAGAARLGATGGLSALIGALDLLQGGQIAKGAGMLGANDSADPDIRRTIRWVEAQLRARQLLRISGICLAVAGICGWIQTPFMGLGLAIGGAALFFLSGAAWRRQFAHLLAQPGAEGLRLLPIRELRAALGGQQKLQ
jgi:hypothetical protein